MAGKSLCALPRSTGPSDWMTSAIRGFPIAATWLISES
jgi:hypothetical protein